MGEPDDPYPIAAAEDLMLLGERPEDYDNHFILTADIDLDPNLPDRKVFDKAVIAPAQIIRFHIVGVSFTGVLDGNGQVVSHLKIKGWTFLGLFGQLLPVAEVRNLGVVGINIIGPDYDTGGSMLYPGSIGGS